MKSTAFALLAVVSALGLFAQTTTSLNGVVTDPTGAAIPGAKINITDTNTGVARDVESDGQGRYQFPAITPGLYKVSAKKDGFADVVVQNLRLLVNTPATLNLTFEKVGSVSQTVEVSAEGATLNTVDATLGNSFGTKPLLQLPFEGRNLAKILSLQSGVSFVGDNDSVNGGVSQAEDRGGVVNGGRSDQSNVTLDGIDVNDQQTRSAFTSVLRVTLDSTQEFRVTTTNANADASRGSGAQVSLVTKSGTNELHGSLYHFLRNRAANANTFFNNLTGLGTPKLNRNIFGGSLGGPIKKNKLFLFGNYEGRRDSFEQSVLRTVPTETLRQGIVRFPAVAGNIVSLTPQDLATGLNYAPGVNQAALNLFRNSYPLPNDPTAGDGINTSGFRFNAPLKDKYDTFISKLDFVMNEKHTFFVRGQLQDDVQNSAPQFPGREPNLRSLTNSKGLALGWNATLLPSLISVTRWGITRQALEDAGIGQYAAVEFRPLSAAVGLDRSFRRISPTYHLTQDFTNLWKSHQFQFGGSHRAYNNDRLSYANSYFGALSNSSWMTASGQILSAPWAAGDLPTNARVNPGARTQMNDAIASVFGLVTQVNSRYNYLPDGSAVRALPQGAPNPRNFRGTETEFYFQDTWRVNRALTVTGGVRHMYWPAISEVNGVQTNTNIPLSEWFDRRVANANAGLGGQTGLPPITYDLRKNGARPLYDNLHNWSPRLSVAYAPQWNNGLAKFFLGSPGKSVFRAGWGMYYDVFGAGLIRAFDASALGLSTNIPNSSGRLTLAETPRFTGIFDIPQALVQPPPPATFPVAQPNNFQITNSLDDRLRAPYVMRWNASFQRDFKGWQTTLSYVASEGRRTLTSEDLATPLNLRDPASGQDWNGASQALIRQLPINERRQVLRAPTAAEVAAIRPIAFWENMFPGLASGGRSATQVAYLNFADFFPDSTAVAESFDRFADPAASRLGRFALYSPQFSYLRGIRSVGSSSYHSMQVNTRKIFRNGDQVDFNWTWSHSIDLGSVTENNQSTGDGNRGVIINPYNRSQMRGSSDFDQRHNFNANYVLNLPFGRGRKFGANINKAANLLIGGWQLSGLMRVSTGLNISVGHNRTWPTNYNLTGWATTVGTFVDGTNKNAGAAVGNGSGPNIFQDPRAAVNAFGFTMPGEIGNRNNVRGDGVANFDASLAKNFFMPYNEKHTVQARWEVFNVTNTVRFDPRNINLSLGNLTNFGRYQGTLQPSRVMQFSLRYDF